ncbi:MAG: hypothetical protein HRU11_09355 [Parvularculaceae bacterium]|nr:hypothetical protein [Parvularculaceae bacterium]
MESQFILVIGVVAAVIAATFILKAMMANILKIAGLLVVGFLSLREAVGAIGFDWILPYQMVIVVAAAFVGWVVSLGLNLVIFRENGFGRAFFSPIIAVACTYVAAIAINIAWA